MDFQLSPCQPGCKFRRTTPIKANAFKRGSLNDQCIEVVGFPGADVGVECAGAYAGAVNVPDADMVRQNAPETFGVGQFVERFGENCTEQFPEMILPVPVILLCCQ